jgi:hypothetical protein
MEFKNKNKDNNANALTDTTPPPTPQTSEQSESRSDDRIVPHEPELIETVIEEELLSDDEDILVHETLKRKSTFYDQYLELQEKKLKLLERSNDIATMKVNAHSFSSPLQRKYFKLRQDEILRRFKEEHAEEFNKVESDCHCNH